MPIDDFMRLVRLLANNTWTRYYLHSPLGQLVLEVALPSDTHWPEQLHKELTAKGFEAHEPIPHGGWTRWSWSIARAGYINAGDTPR